MPFLSQETHSQPQPMGVYLIILEEKRIYAIHNEINNKKL
jgi:hypothetical protein